MISESSGAVGTLVPGDAQMYVHMLPQPCLSTKGLATLCTDVRFDIVVNDCNMFLKLILLVIGLAALLTHKIFTDSNFQMNLVDVIFKCYLVP